MMTKSKAPRDVATQHTVIVRALSSITPKQAETIVRDVQASGSAWIVQTYDDYDGYLSILVQPAVHDDEQKSFVISGTAQHLELFEAQGDNMVALASVSDVNMISAQLLDLIAQQ